jgi:hypothetical protein
VPRLIVVVYNRTIFQYASKFGVEIVDNFLIAISSINS